MVPLPVAAYMLGQTYRACYELMMRRCLRGELRGKRWWVSLADVRKLDQTGRTADVTREQAAGEKVPA